MKSFKDCIAEDIQNVFINLDEFGELRRIDGREISVVIDDDILEEKNLKDINNIYGGDKLIYVSAKELGYIPKVGNNIRLDNDIWQVNDVKYDMGVLAITLVSNKGR